MKHEVFKTLTTLHSKNPRPQEPQYPILRTLLKFDTREFLNVLALAFEEAEFTSELGMIQRQRVVDILMQVGEETLATFPLIFLPSYAYTISYFS